MLKLSSPKIVIFATSLSLFASASIAVPANASTFTENNNNNTSNPVSISEIAGDTQSDGSTVFTTEQSQFTVLPATETQLSEEQKSTMARFIACTLDVPHAHPSSHVSGTVNGVAKISCNEKAGGLTLHYSLIRMPPRYTQWAAPLVSNAGNKFLQTNRAISCKESPADFRDWAQGVIVPPPGYQLAGPARDTKYGSIMPVVCGVSKISTNELPGGETTTVTFIRSDLAN